MRQASPQKPLALRRDYDSAERDLPVAQSGLPGQGPADKGLSLDKDIPGTSTFNKPEGDKREFDKSDPGSIYRRDTPDEMAKPQDDQKQDERDMGYVRPRYTDPGGRPPGDQSITKYPYRSDRKYRHNASVEFVRESYLAQEAPSINLPVLVTDDGVRVATNIGIIETGLNPLVVQRSGHCTAQLKRADIPNARWIFSVDCGNGPKVVRVKADRKGNVAKLSKMDLKISCSCPAWRWLGSEHWAKNEVYIDGKPVGTASTPVIKDPEGINRVCKHVAAVLSTMRGWQLGPKRQAIKTAAAKRAHAVRAAERALQVDTFAVGYKVQWDDAPKSIRPLYVRATGKPEFAKSQYQVRKEGEVWPSTWQSSRDLAESLCQLGLSSRWASVPGPVRLWVMADSPSDFFHQVSALWGK